jgi:hypothetical protein
MILFWGKYSPGGKKTAQFCGRLFVLSIFGSLMHVPSSGIPRPSSDGGASLHCLHPEACKIVAGAEGNATFASFTI